MAAPVDEVVLTTCPRDCYDACGIAVVKRDGAIRHVRGDPAHPVSRGRLCRKCSIGYNGAFLDPQVRLTRPLRRVGAKGEGRFEPISWERGAWRDRRAAAADPGDCRRAHCPERPLHGHVLAARLLLPAALLPPARRYRGRPGHDLQQGRARGARVRVRDLARRLRSVDRARLGLHSRLGREPVRVGAPRPRALASGGAGTGDRGRPGAHADRRGRRPPPPALPRQRRRPRLRAPACDRPRGPRRSSTSSPRTRSAGRSSSRCLQSARQRGARPPQACRPA